MLWRNYDSGIKNSGREGYFRLVVRVIRILFLLQFLTKFGLFTQTVPEKAVWLLPCWARNTTNESRLYRPSSSWNGALKYLKTSHAPDSCFVLLLWEFNCFWMHMNVNWNQAKYVFLEMEHLVLLSGSFVCLNQLCSLTDVFGGNGDISFYNAKN